MVRLCVRLLLAAILLPIFMSVSSVAAEPPWAQYLLFQSLIGGPDPNGSYRRNLFTPEVLQIVRRVADIVRPARRDRSRIPGFSAGPVAMDEGEDDARSVIRDAFDIALATDMAVALHLDDYMFWAQARRPLRIIRIASTYP